MRPMKMKSRHNQRDVSLPRVSSRSGSGSVRIIAGMWRRTPLTVSDAMGLRPTGDRIRETLFNWLMFFFGDLANRSALDMFAGSGALGFEFASRGGQRVLMFEKNTAAHALLKATQEKLNANQIELVRGDVLSLLPNRDEQFDIIFIDPPFALNYHEKAIKAALTHLKTNGVIYIESQSEWDCQELFEQLHLEVVREGHSGAVAYRLAKIKDLHL